MTSKIKVDNINKVSDDSNIIKKCGTTTTVGSGSGQTIVVDGATVTLGRCGGAVNLASGATQTGFGQAVSAANFCTTVKTSPFSATAGTGFFVNTSGGAVTVTLPGSPSAGDVIALKDYKNTWDSNNVTLARNGSKINGSSGCATLNVRDQSVTLIYVDATAGWKTIMDSTSDVSGSGFLTATGGSITTCGDFKIHTFNASGTFCVSDGGGPVGIADYLVVAGGGGAGGANWPGGGGAGGFREAKTGNNGTYTASPLASSTGIPFGFGTFPVTIGAGASGGGSPSKGSNSVLENITSSGGGSGFSNVVNPGGSGGGASCPGTSNPGGTGNDPPVSPPQGNPGGVGGWPGGPLATGGGGGATAAGGAGSPNPNSGNGGAGATTNITGSPVTLAGGGGGTGGYNGASAGSGGPGGGGAGGSNPGPLQGTNGTANTGGGAGGSNEPTTANGGSGVVVIRYKFQ